MPRTGRHKNTDPPETRRLHGFLRKTLEGDDVVVVRKCCVNVGTVEVKVVHPNPPSSVGMQGSVNDACEEPLRPRRGVWENSASHCCPPLQESDLDFVLPSAMRGLRRPMLPVATGGDVCCVLKCCGGRTRPPIRCPDWRVVVNTVLPQFSDFIPVM